MCFTICTKSIPTFLVCCINTLSHLFFAVCVNIHVREDPGLVGPQVVVGAKEMDWKFPHIVPHPLDVIRDGFRMANLRRPPPKVKNHMKGRTLNTFLKFVCFMLCSSFYSIHYSQYKKTPYLRKLEIFLK